MVLLFGKNLLHPLLNGRKILPHSIMLILVNGMWEVTMLLSFFFLIFIYLFIYFWLCWVFVSVRGPSPVAASGGHSSSRRAGPSPSRPLLLRSTGSRHAGSVIVAHGPSCSAACGIPPDQGSNPCPLHRQADSQPLRHQGSPMLLSSEGFKCDLIPLALPFCLENAYIMHSGCSFSLGPWMWRYMHETEPKCSEPSGTCWHIKSARNMFAVASHWSLGVAFCAASWII